MRLKKHLIWNLVIGFVITVLVGWMQARDVKWVVGVEDAAVDWVMSLRRGAAPSAESVPLAFVDIDEATYWSWGEPFHSPRPALVRLLETAKKSPARVVLLDIDLSRRGFDAVDDEALVEFLRRYPADAPPIAIVRTFRVQTSKEKPQVEPRVSSIPGLEEVIRENPALMWASSLFPVEHDGAIRRWRLWETVCRGDKADVIVSIQLLVAGIVRGELDPAITSHSIEQQLSEYEKSTCSGSRTRDASEVGKLNVGRWELNLGGERLTQRLIYAIPWKYRPGESSATLKTETGKRVPLMTRRSALPIVQGENVDTSWLRDRVVVIGGSYRDSRDLHATPIGQMPGAVVIANSINSLMNFGLIHRPSIWVRMIILAVLIVVMTLIFTRFSSFLGMLIAGGIVLVALVPLSYWLFSSGVWLDFAIPLLVVQMHEMVSTFKEELGH